MNGEPSPERGAKTPASRRTRTLVATTFVAVWLLATLADFFLLAEPVLPGWFHMTGLVVLGFMLGVSLDDVRPGPRN